MIKKIILLFLFMTMMVTSCESQDFTKAAKSSKYVVEIQGISSCDSMINAGSAVIVREDGYIVTNHHVIKNIDKGIFIVYENDTLPAKLIGDNEY